MDMASSIIIIALGLLMMFCGCNAVGGNGGDPSESSISGYGCDYCCSRIDNQTKHVGEIKIAVVDDIPSELQRQAASMAKQSSELKEVKTSVSDISIILGKQSSEIAVSLNKHSEDLLIHDARLKEQGLLLADLSRLVMELHESLVGPKDCSDIRALGYSTSGVYRVYPGSLAKRIQADVYCDMTTPGGNWLVFQRRKDGSVNFERTWVEYMNGFGMPSGEFWLGNELLYVLTSNRKYKLRIDMEDFDGQKRYAEYSTFSISSSADHYRLNVAGYSGNAGDSLHMHHNGMKFSTKDVDNDSDGGNCAQGYHGAWWYYHCHLSNLNGRYLRGPHKSYADGVNWFTFRGHHYSLKTTEMKISKVN